MLTHLDLFSGIGGFALAAQWAGFRTVGFCEREPYAQQVLAERFNAEFKAEKMPRDLLAYTKELQRNGCKHHAGIDSEKHGALSKLGNGSRPRLHPDIFTINGADYAGVDLLTGGFPCQPFSVAGKRLGAADDRAIWPQMLRVIDEARPAWVLGENVPGIINMELDNVLSQLEGIGYAAWPLVIPACAVDAKHRRDRVWIVAHADQGRLRRAGAPRDSGHAALCSEDVAAAGSERQLQRRPAKPVQSQYDPPELRCSWRPEAARFAESGMGGGFDGLSAKLDKNPTLNETAKTRGRKVLRELQNANAAEAIQWTAGRFHGVSKEEVLLAVLCQHDADPDAWRSAVEGGTIANLIVRGVWRHIEFARASHRPESGEQHAGEYPDALRELSRQAPSLYAQAWSSDCWEDGLPRVANGVKHRAHRLRGLGNAIVPQVAFQIIQAIRSQVTP